MKKNRIDINLGCGHTILSFFWGSSDLLPLLELSFFCFLPFCFTDTSPISKSKQLVTAKG